MLLNNLPEYKNGLFNLWKNVFKDEDEYICLLFSTLYDIDKLKVFAFIEEKKIVSALYLLDINLKYHNQIYHGFYLYAAATDSEQRQKGLMSKLIEEAKEYSVQNDRSFISLVPANEQLYSFYYKLGFKTAMHKKEFDKTVLKNIFDSEISECSCDEYLKNRKELDCNFMFFEKNEFSYALKCLDYYSIKSYKTQNGTYFVSDIERENIIEMFVSNKETTRLIPIDNSINKFGMIYPIDNDLKQICSFADIYMNFALD